MSFRNRSRNITVTGSYYAKHSGVTTVHTRSFHSESTDDTTGEGDNFPFDSRKMDRDGGIINGDTSPGTPNSGYIYSNYPINAVHPFTTVGTPTSQTNAYYASQCLARTNPSRPSVQALVNGLELAELPLLLKSEMDGRMSNLLRSVTPRKWASLTRVAKFHLMVQFGVLPLIDDAKKMLTFSKLVDQRVKELEKLSSRGLRRTVALDSVSLIENTTGYTMISGIPGSYTVNFTKLTTLVVRGHVRWQANGPIPSTADSRRDLARSVVAGLHWTPHTSYELMPWSWFIDYFTNLGSIVKAASNIVPVTHDSVRIMRHTKSVVQVTKETKPSAVSISTPHFVNSRKTREIAFPSLSAHVGMLDAHQLSILGSLSIVKSL